MSQTVNERVAEEIQRALETTDYTVTSLSEELNVSRNTIYRWRDKESKDIKKTHLEAISNVLHVNLDWLRYGNAGRSDDPMINEIERRVAEKGESYKGLDQTLSDVELKASSLIQDLQDLLVEIENLKNRSDE